MEQSEKGVISGKEALIALANGEEIENWNGSVWWSVEGTWQLDVFLKTDRKFRIKPKPMLLNGIEVPPPFEPKDGEKFWIISDDYMRGYTSSNLIRGYSFGAWHTEEEIKQVVTALRKVFGG